MNNQPENETPPADAPIVGDVTFVMNGTAVSMSFNAFADAVVRSAIGRIRCEIEKATSPKTAEQLALDIVRKAPPFVLECSHTETLGTNPGYKIGVMDGRGGEYVVRRLTPRECERLQGFPDDWTRIPYRGKPAEECPDGPRYKAMGNSWGTNCAEWILRRILAARPVWHPEPE